MNRAREVLLGRRSDGRPLHFPSKLRQLSTHIIGAPRRGKSKLLEWLIRQYILNGQGLCLLDPHGSLYDAIVKWAVAVGLIPEEQRILLFEPRHEDFLFGFNPLRGFNGLAPGQRADAIAAMVRAVAEVWGGEDMTRTPRLARCLPAVLNVLAEKGLTLREGAELCHRSDLQRAITRDLADETHRLEWEYFNAMGDREFRETFESTLHRLTPFRIDPLVRGVITQTEWSLDFGRAMDERAVVLVNLARLSEDNKRILGVLMVNDLFTRGIQRAADTSAPFTLFADEAYYFFNDDIERILFGLRKFGVHAVLAHHTLSQLDKAGQGVRSAVMQIPNKVMFGGLLVEDAKELAEQAFTGEFRVGEIDHRFDKKTVDGYVTTILEAHSSTTGTGSAAASAIGKSSAETTTSGETGAARAEAIMASVSELASSGESEFESETSAWHEALMPVLKEGPTKTVDYQDEVYRAVATMVTQPTQYAIAKLSGQRSAHIRVPTVSEAVTTDEFVEVCKRHAYNRTYFVSPMELAETAEARRRAALKERSKELLKPEPASYRQPMRVKRARR